MFNVLYFPLLVQNRRYYGQVPVGVHILLIQVTVSGEKLVEITYCVQYERLNNHRRLSSDIETSTY